MVSTSLYFPPGNAGARQPSSTAKPKQTGLMFIALRARRSHALTLPRSHAPTLPRSHALTSSLGGVQLLVGRRVQHGADVEADEDEEDEDASGDRPAEGWAVGGAAVFRQVVD